MTREHTRTQPASMLTAVASPAPSKPLMDLDWEGLWAPYDEATYRAALDLLEPDDVVLDIGAGDLRFARQAALRVQTVLAIERNSEVLASRPYGLDGDPANLTVICGDALSLPFPASITTGVLLMRHCRHFKEFVLRLRAAGCRSLITNARWGMDVERMTLAPQPSFGNIPGGWYACVCGAVGFKATLQEEGAEALDGATTVEDCPVCLPSLRVSEAPHGREQ